MRVVLDANVLIAAFATHGLCHAVFEICLTDHTFISSQDILDDVEEKLRKKIKVPAKTVEDIRFFLKKNAHLEAPSDIDPSACRDPEDAKVLGLALASRADCLVSGDQDLLILKSFEGIPILSPRDFYQRLRAA
jgi:putative PIN family toxin of toxin-antitoxin system